jgi:hypothetical protein
MKNRLIAEMGLRLPRQATRMLKDRGIYAYAPVSLAHQHLAARHVVRGIESGGSVGDLGRYVTFAAENGQPIDCLHQVDAIGVNGVHSIVIAPVLVRIDMLRIGRTYELLITRHKPNKTGDAKRPQLQTDTLYRGIHGRLEMDLEQTRAALGGLIPTFYSFAGEEVPIPNKFRQAVSAATRGTNCTGCTHSHYVPVARKVESHVVESAQLAPTKAEQSARTLPVLSAGIGAETESANGAA